MQGTRASYAVSIEIYSSIAMRVGYAALSSWKGGVGAVKGVREEDAVYMHSYISYSGPEGSEAFHTFFHMLSWGTPG